MIHKIFWTLIAGAFLLVSVADVRVFKNIPVYPLDALFLLLIGINVFLLTKKNYFKDTTPTIWFALGLLIVSSEISWILNGTTATGLGQLKSWIVLPSIAAFTSALVWQKDALRNRTLLLSWFMGLVALLVIVMPYIFSHTLTFDGRLQGPFTSPNFLAFFLMPGILLSYYFWQQSRQQGHRLFYVLLGTLFLFVLFSTYSFGAWLAVAGGVVFYAFQNISTKKLFTTNLFILCAVAALLVAGLATQEKFSNILEERSSLASRITIWTVAVEAIQDAPLFGIGIGRFQEVYLAYQPLFPPYLEWAVPQPHNIVLALWLQTGAFGLLAIIFLGYRALFTKSSSPEQALLRALFVGILIYGIFDTPLFGNALAFLWWTVLAFLLFPVNEKKKGPQFSEGPNGNDQIYYQTK